jgi:hypothetical protein
MTDSDDGREGPWTLYLVLAVGAVLLLLGAAAVFLFG